MFSAVRVREAGEEYVEPFGLSETLDADEIREIRKRELSNLLTSYADEADVFSEMIQNGFDAVMLAKAKGQFAEGTAPRLDIFIGRRSGDEHYFAVVDNGVGMDPDIASRFSIPGWGLGKERGKTVGHKGIGASFVVAATNRFALSTSGAAGTRTQMTISNAYTWIRNLTAPSPVVSDTADFPLPVENAIPARGTAVCVYFHEGMRPSKLSWVVTLSDDPEQEVANWASYLCLKTSLGQARDNGLQDFVVRFHLDRGGSLHSYDWRFGPPFSRNNRTLGYPFPNNVLAVAEPISQIDRIPDTHKHLHRNRYQALVIDLSKEDVDAIDLSTEEREVVQEHFESAHLYYAYSVSLLDEIRKRLGTTHFRHGIKLVVDNVPQGRLIDFSLTRNQGLDRQMHAVISFRGLELDSGRKIPANEDVASAIRKIGTYIAGKAGDYKFFIRKKELPEKPADLSKWREEIIERRKDSLAGALFKAKGYETPLHADPYSESDVIALTAGMLARGMLKGLRLYSLSSSAIYDCLADIVCSEPELRTESDPLSVRTLGGGRERDLGVVEFKFVFESLIADFQNNVKRAADIHLLICWDVGSLNVGRGQLDFWYGPKADRREVYAATHVWTDDNLETTIPVISLKHVVAILLAEHEAKAGTQAMGAAKLADLLARDEKDQI